MTGLPGVIFERASVSNKLLHTTCQLYHYAIAKIPVILLAGSVHNMSLFVIIIYILISGYANRMFSDLQHTVH